MRALLKNIPQESPLPEERLGGQIVWCGLVGKRSHEQQRGEQERMEKDRTSISVVGR